MRKQPAKHLIRPRLKQEFGRAFEQLETLSRAFFQLRVHRLDLAHRQQRAHLRLLHERGDEIGEENVRGVRFPFDEQLLRQSGYGPRFAEQRRVLVRELRGELPFGARHEL